MKKLILLSFLFFSIHIIYCQETQADSICMSIDDLTTGYSIVLNDPIWNGNPENGPFIQGNDCVYLNDMGELFIFPGADPEFCCGESIVRYFYQGPAGQAIFEEIYLTIKCDAPKPDCAIVDLELYKDPSSLNEKLIINACEESAIVYSVNDLPGIDYTWNLGGVPYSFLAGDHTIEVTWPNTGSYTIILEESVGGVVTNTYTFCIDVIDSPDADFSVLNGCGCLNSPVSFNNLSVGGSDFFWKFGDGNTSSDVSPTHTYTVPGIYDVTLYVTQDNYDAQGNPLCCCTDSIVYPVTIDPLEGPNIYWISTLCEGDTSKYWTDAQVCDYMWTVEDADGVTVPIIITSANNDTICVVWGSGPYGIVSLEVDNCTMGTYCTKPISATVPIIQSNANITGEDTVCVFNTYNYTVPKWGTVEYNWSIDPASAGTIIGGQGTNSITINWISGPTNAIVSVDYGSDFLNGLPNHMDGDCDGSASLDVDILLEWDIVGPPGPICIDENITFSPSLPAINGYTWITSPLIGTTTGLLNSPYTVSFPSAGTYVVKAAPNFPNPFCNDTVVRYIQVIGVPEPDSLSGNKEICEGDVELYFGHGAGAGTSYMWSAQGGSIVGSNMGNPVTINWDGAPPFGVYLKNVMINDPLCKSDSIFCPIDTKSLFPFDSISVAIPCVNKIGYATVYQTQHADATYDWSISPANKGSIVSGDNSITAEIQWNDMAGPVTLTCEASLCGNTVTISKTLNINEAIPPIITQSASLCPGDMVTLNAGTGFNSYNWSPSGSGQIISITTAGDYRVTVTDANMCTAIATHQVVAHPSPNVSISTIGSKTLCVGAGGSVEIHGLDGDVMIEWFENGSSIGPGSPDQATITHTNTNIVNSTTYCYVATDNSTGCTAKSNTVTINQIICSGGPGGTGGCTPAQNYSLSINAVNQMPDCNIVDFAPVNPDGTVTVSGWDFNDPSGSYTGPTSNPTFEFSKAGYFTVFVYGTVPDNVIPAGGVCDVSASTNVCVPLVADFDFSVLCDVATFTDASTFTSGGPITWSWDFGDGNSSIAQHPSNTYATGGTYTVTLTISRGGCTSSYTQTVIIPNTGTPTLLHAATACEGEEVIFSNFDDTGIIAWDWNFGDGSSNGDDSPSHAYLTTGTYPISLIVTDETGCTGMGTSSIFIHPAPSPDTILYMPDLLVCDGDSLELIAPLGPGSTYLWNTGAITKNIFASTTGTYAVSVVDPNGCDYVPDSVMVTILPPIDSTIVGPTTICDDGCITLFAVQAFGFTYEWRDQSGILRSTTYDVEICASDGVTALYLNIIDANGCVATNSVNIQYANSPTISIASSDPSLCEGVPIVLTANAFPFGPAYEYQWSTTATTQSITVISAGVYTVFVTDPDTGCSESASITINPIPDLCIVPHGCYEACDPDTLCGPDGLISYIWTKDGVFFGSGQCITVMESGAYNLTGTNSFNCSNTSDTLYLEMIPCCKPENTSVSAIPLSSETPCCYEISYDNTPDYFDKLVIRSNEATINLDYPSLDPSLVVSSNIGGYTIVNNTPATPLPNGNLVNFATICLSDAIVNPVQVIFDWHYGDEICSDTLELACEAEPDCIYLADCGLYCEGEDQWIMDLTICNPVDATHDIGYIDMANALPSGINFSPSFFYPSPALQPGDCQNFQITITGNYANTNFYFDLIGHENDPNDDPGTLCCKSDSTYCKFLPGCTECDMVYISSVDSSDIGDCCYDITLHNYFNDMTFTGIDICVLTTGSTISSSNTTTNWTTSNINGTNISWDYTGTTGLMPIGYSTLPTICIDESEEAITQIEIKWMQGAEVYCRDTITISCPGDCGYMSDIMIDCNPQGGWNISGYITNTSMDTMDTAYINWGDPALDLYNISINLGGLPPGGTYGPFNLYLANANAGQELCVITTLHALDHGEEHEECCEFKTTITLPDCATDERCLCDKNWRDQVDLGFHCIQTSNTSFGFTPIGSFEECDKISWSVDGIFVGSSAYNQSFIFNFTGFGEYRVCMTVTRYDDNGESCKRRYCKEVMILGASQLNVFPNPVLDNLNVSFESISTNKMASIKMYTLNNKLVLDTETPIDETVSTFDVSRLNTGTYIMKVTAGEEEFIKYILIVD